MSDRKNDDKLLSSEYGKHYENRGLHRIAPEKASKPVFSPKKEHPDKESKDNN